MSRRGEGEGGVEEWLPLIGGVAVGVGFLALIYKLFFGRRERCLREMNKTPTWPCQKQKPTPYYKDPKH